MSLGSPGSVYKRKNGYVLGVRLVVAQLAQTSQGSSGPGPVMPVPKRRLSTATRDSNLETSSPINPVASHPLAPFFPHLPAHAPSRSKTFLVHQSEAFIASSLQPFVFRFHFLLPTLFNCRLLPTPISSAHSVEADLSSASFVRSSNLARLPEDYHPLHRFPSSKPASFLTFDRVALATADLERETWT